jgi:hypothetical protein
LDIAGLPQDGPDVDLNLRLSLCLFFRHQLHPGLALDVGEGLVVVSISSTVYEGTVELVILVLNNLTRIAVFFQRNLAQNILNFFFVIYQLFLRLSSRLNGFK